jgi:hypothetical protein
MLRKFLAMFLCGPLWFAGMNVFFIYSGAQNLLANPKYQSSKFLDVFMSIEPLPRMVSDQWLVLKGLFITGFFMCAVLIFFNGKVGGNWLMKGLKFGIITWALVIPWFEFYLPYNVMHEPFMLVLFECLLWLGAMLFTCTGVSFILNFKTKK